MPTWIRPAHGIIAHVAVAVECLRSGWPQWGTDLLALLVVEHTPRPELVFAIHGTDNARLMDIDGQWFIGDAHHAMRVAPLGACVADAMALVVEQAARSAIVTHSHPEAVAGAMAVAVAAAMAWQLRHEAQLPLATFLERLVPCIPHSQVCEQVTLLAHLPADANIWQVIQAVGNGSSITAQDTVPFALWCAAQHRNDYPAALWLTASGLGDIDTNCAIVGGIVASAVGSAGIPPVWLQHREPLPAWLSDRA